MLLVLNGARANRNVRKYVGEIAVIFRVQHFVSGCKSIILDHAHMELTDCNKSLIHIRLLLRIRLMKHSLVAAAGGTRFVRVYTRYDHKLILYLLINLRKTAHILTYSVLAVRGTWSDNYKELFALSCDDIRNFFISCHF